MWPFPRKTPAPEPEQAAPVRKAWAASLDLRSAEDRQTLLAIARAEATLCMRPAGAGFAMDGAEGDADVWGDMRATLPPGVVGWFASQGFIGHSMCAILSQHWLIAKACGMPGRDASRQGFQLLTYSEDTAQEIDKGQQSQIEEQIRRADRKYHLAHNLTEFVQQGRVFGVRIALFRVKGKGPEFYENPFNIDAVGPGEYLGISQVDPQWCAPLLSDRAASDPASIGFYEPEWWLIRGQKYHKSHLVIFRNGILPDVLKPAYLYGGLPVPQLIFQRVYAAERTADEAPQLAMSKRSSYLKTDLTVLMADQEKAARMMAEFSRFRDNYGVKLVDIDDDFEQHDTGLADFDALIMTQYQLVAAAAGVPATKLLGTTPKGFNSSGDYEAASYHEELETIQKHDMQPLVARHHELVMRSEVEPDLGLEPGSIRVEIKWNAVDSPTARVAAETAKIEADRDLVLVQAGIIDPADGRARLRADPSSGYADLADDVDPIDVDDPFADA